MNKSTLLHLAGKFSIPAAVSLVIVGLAICATLFIESAASAKVAPYLASIADAESPPAASEPGAPVNSAKPAEPVVGGGMLVKLPTLEQIQKSDEELKTGWSYE